MEYWSDGVMKYLVFTITPILHHSNSSESLYFLIHGGIWILPVAAASGKIATLSPFCH